MDFTVPKLDGTLSQGVFEASQKVNSLEGQGAAAYYAQVWQICGRAGLLGLPISREYGGQALDAQSTAAVFELFGETCKDMGMVFSVGAHLFAATMPIFEYGSADTKHSFLPRLCDGRWIGANAITERGAGSDTSALALKVEKCGDSYVLNGTKSYVSNGPVADVFTVYGTTDPEFGHLGLNAFAVRAEQEGVTVGEPFKKMGLSSCLASTVEFRDCIVPVSQRLGAEGQGANIFRTSMLWERSCLFAGYVGLLSRILAICVKHAQTRTQFGSTLGKFQAVSHKITEMSLRLETSRLLLYKACWLLSRGERAVSEVAMAKLEISEAVVQASLDAVQILGGEGYKCGEAEEMLRDALPCKIFSGTSEMQREIIARELGL